MIALVFGTSASPVHALSPAPEAGSAPAAAPAAAARESGILFKATRDEHTVFVYGTVHLGNASFYPLGPRTLQPLLHSQALLVEVDVLDPGLGDAFRRHGTLSPQQPANRFTPEQDKLVDPLLGAGGIDPAFGRRIKPDILASTLSSLDAAKLGYTSAFSVESFLLGFAHARRIKVIELEGLQAQLAMNDTLGQADRQEILDHTLKGIASGRSRAQVAELVDAWRASDFERISNRSSVEAQPFKPAYFEQQMVQRNESMVHAIDALSKEHQRLFVAVGVLHLVGSSGLPAALSRIGFRVDRMF